MACLNKSARNSSSSSFGLYKGRILFLTSSAFSSLSVSTSVSSDLNSTSLKLLMVLITIEQAKSISSIQYTLLSSRLSNNNGRSEDHTSELQSRPHLVCRLLL